MLMEIAKEDGGDNAVAQAANVARVERGFIAEIRRLTNVFLLGEKGWEMVPLEDAKKSGMIDADEASEVDNAIVFFTCASRSHLKSQMAEVRGALAMWNARTESLSCTEFRNSLQTSTEAANTTKTATP
jgi:hypothetical protein